MREKGRPYCGMRRVAAEHQEGTVNGLKSVNSRKSITGYEAKKRDLQRFFYLEPISFLAE